MAIVSISEAAKLVRKGRQTLYNHNEKGKLSFTKTAAGKPGIDTAELQRVYGKLYMSADKVKTVAVDNNDNVGQSDSPERGVNKSVDTQVSHSDSAKVDSVSTVSWFIEQVDESKRALADTQAQLLEREQTLAELRKAIAVLPSPESIERRLAEQASQLKQRHSQIIEAERSQSARQLVEQQQNAARQSEQWQQSIAERKMEIEQARADLDESRQRQADQAQELKLERDRVIALESRGLLARLFNKKPSLVS